MKAKRRLNRASGSGQMWAQLQLARSYVPLDPDQSFAIVQPLIAKANDCSRQRQC